MKKSNIIKILPVLVAFFIIFSNLCYVEAGIWSDIRSQINSFQSQGQTVNINTQNVVNPFVELTQILMTIGAGILVAVTTYMGIKYLTSGPEAQAKLKVQLIGIVVSGFVIFGAYFIWKIVLTFANESFS